MRIAERLSIPPTRVTEPSTRAATQPAAPPSQGWAPKASRAAAPVERPAHADGNAFCVRALADIEARSARGEKVRVVFDIDDTLSESRARTLAVAKGWDKANGTNYFDRLVVAQVGSNGAETARALNLPDDVSAAFQQHWAVEFWKAESFAHDTPTRS